MEFISIAVGFILFFVLFYILFTFHIKSILNFYHSSCSDLEKELFDKRKLISELDVDIEKKREEWRLTCCDIDFSREILRNVRVKIKNEIDKVGKK